MATMIAEIFISLLAVFGLYAAVRLFCSALFAPKELAETILLEREMTEDEVVYLVWRAREGWFEGKRRLIALLKSGCVSPSVTETLLALGVECYEIKQEERRG